MPTIAAFMKADPLAGRSRAESSTQSRRHPLANDVSCISFTAGRRSSRRAKTELYAYWLARQQQTVGRGSVYVALADPARAHGEAVELLDDGIRVRLVTNNFTARNPFAATPSAIGSSIGLSNVF